MPMLQDPGAYPGMLNPGQYDKRWMNLQRMVEQAAQRNGMTPAQMWAILSSGSQSGMMFDPAMRTGVGPGMGAAGAAPAPPMSPGDIPGGPVATYGGPPTASLEREDLSRPADTDVAGFGASSSYAGNPNLRAAPQRRPTAPMPPYAPPGAMERFQAMDAERGGFAPPAGPWSWMQPQGSAYAGPPQAGMMPQQTPAMSPAQMMQAPWWQFWRNGMQAPATGPRYGAWRGDIGPIYGAGETDRGPLPGARW